MMIVVRRLQELARKNTPFYLCFDDVTRAYEPIHRTLLWNILARFGVSPRMVAVARQFHDGMQACVRLDDGSARISSTLGKVFGKGVCSRHCCSTCLSRWCCVSPRNPSPLMQPSCTTWCSSNERRRKERREAHHAQSKSTGGGGRRRRRCIGCGVCCTPQCGHRTAISRTTGEADVGDCNCVLGVQACGLRGQKQRLCVCRLKVGGRCCSPSLQPARYTNDRVCVLGWGYHCRQRSQFRDNSASSEGLGVFPAVQHGNL